MNSLSWQGHPIRVEHRSEVRVEVKASAAAVVIAQGDGVWFHDLHLENEEHVVALINDLSEGLVQMRAMRSTR